MTDIEDIGRVRDEARDGLQEALYEIKRVIVGQDAMLERLLVSLLAGGHVLLEGVPGLAKTLTVKTLAGVLGGTYGRIQFTPDLVPADLVGTLTSPDAPWIRRASPVWVLDRRAARPAVRSTSSPWRRHRPHDAIRVRSSLQSRRRASCPGGDGRMRADT